MVKIYIWILKLQYFSCSDFNTYFSLVILFYFQPTRYYFDLKYLLKADFELFLFYSSNSFLADCINVKHLIISQATWKVINDVHQTK